MIAEFTVKNEGDMDPSFFYLLFDNTNAKIEIMSSYYVYKDNFKVYRVTDISRDEYNLILLLASYHIVDTISDIIEIKILYKSRISIGFEPWYFEDIKDVISYN